MDVLNNQNESEIKAPMPGRALDIMLNAGDAVAKGDGVLVLEGDEDGKRDKITNRWYY